MGQLAPLLDRCVEQAGCKPKGVLADAGVVSNRFETRICGFLDLAVMEDAPCDRISFYRIAWFSMDHETLDASTV